MKDEILQKDGIMHTFLLALRNLSGSNPSTILWKRKNAASV